MAMPELTKEQHDLYREELQNWKKRRVRGLMKWVPRTRLTGADFGDISHQHVGPKPIELREGDYFECTFATANLDAIDLRHAILRNCNLRHPDLKAKDLAGADLGGARILRELDAEINRPEALLRQVQYSKRTLWATVCVCAYAVFMVSTLGDSRLLDNATTIPLDLLGVAMPTRWLIVGSGVVLTILYFGLHHYLHKLYRVLATLPAALPNGDTVLESHSPWIFNIFVTQRFPVFRNPHSVSSRTYWVATLLIGWCLVPFVLLCLWVAYFPAQNLSGTLVLAFCVVLALVLSMHSERCVTALLTVGDDTKAGMAPWQHGLWAAVAVAVTIASLVGWAYPSRGLNIGETPLVVTRDWPRSQDYSRALSTALAAVGISSVADLRDQLATAAPVEWQVWWRTHEAAFAVNGLEADDRLYEAHPVQGVRPMFGSGLHLAWASLVGVQAQRAILAAAILRDADLRFANLRGAVLVDADLSGADFRHADLRDAHLDGALASEKTRWAYANLEGADLTDVQSLAIRELQNARNWFLASYSTHLRATLGLTTFATGVTRESVVDSRVYRRSGGWVLDFSGFRSEWLRMRASHLRYVNFEGAQVGDADFSDADLRYGAFRDATFRTVDLSRANVALADFRRASGISPAAAAQSLNWRFAFWDAALLKQLGLPDTHNERLAALDFTGQDLANTVLQDLNLNGANFSRANLRGADLRNSSFRDATFDGADLAMADLRGSMGLNSVGALNADRAKWD